MRGVAEALDNLPDHDGGHRARHGVKPLGRRGGRRVGERHVTVRALANGATGMEQLAEHPAIVRMAGLHHLAVTGDAILAGGHQQVTGIVPAFLVDGGDLDDDQPRTASRPRAQIGGERIARRAVCQVGVVAGEQDAVLERDATDLDRGEQIWKVGRHDRDASLSANPRPRHTDTQRRRSRSAAPAHYGRPTGSWHLFCGSGAVIEPMRVVV